MAPASISATSFTVTNTTTNAPVAGTVTYTASSRTATFTPSVALASASQYRATITSAATDVAGNRLAGTAAALPNESDYTWNFATGLAPDLTQPTVNSTVPVPGGTGVSTSAPVTVVFSEGMAPSSLNEASFTVSNGTAVRGTVNYSAADRRATFTPRDALANGSQFTATITAAATDMAGNKLSGSAGAQPPDGSPYIWTFTTVEAPDTTAPTVTGTLPDRNDVDVDTTRSITAVFNEAMQAISLTTTSFTLTPAVGNDVSGTVSYDDEGGSLAATFTPDEDLEPGTVYTATIINTVTDLTGNPLVENYTWNFTTAFLPDVTPPFVIVTDIFPGNDTLALCQVDAVSVRFNERMSRTSITSSTYTVSIGGAAVDGGITFTDGDTQAVFRTLLGVPLAANSTIDVFVKGGEDGVKDRAGNPMVGDVSWFFRTQTAQQCPTNVSLGEAAPFGGFGGDAGMTNKGIKTVINGAIGSTAVCTSFTGFHDRFDTYTIDGSNDGEVNGVVYCAPPPPGTPEKKKVADDALADASLALLALQAKPDGSAQGDFGELGGLRLYPGVYKAADGTYEITSDLILDAKDDPNAVWVFQAAETLTVGTAGPVTVTLEGGAKAENVYWAVGSSARIEDGSSMVGTIIANASVTISTVGQAAVTTLNGRAIGLGASVTMSNTEINVPPETPPVSPP